MLFFLKYEEEGYVLRQSAIKTSSLHGFSFSQKNWSSLWYSEPDCTSFPRTK